MSLIHAVSGRLGRLRAALTDLRGQVRMALARTLGQALGDALRDALALLLGDDPRPPARTPRPHPADGFWPGDAPDPDPWPAGHDELDDNMDDEPPPPPPSWWRRALTAAAETWAWLTLRLPGPWPVWLAVAGVAGLAAARRAPG
jgi:hypothetical protein